MRVSRRVLVLAGLVVVLAGTNVAVARQEQVVRHGDVMFVELAPVDPRSLIQGDYMRLDYAIARDVRRVYTGTLPHSGLMVVALDDSVARFVRLQHGDTPPGAGEHLLRYRVTAGRIRIATNAYFFAEGQASRYAQARFGVLRVADDGVAVLVALADGNRQPLTAAP